MTTFYRCYQDTPLGAKIIEFFDKAQHAARCADEYARDMGAVSYIQPVQYFEGGVDFLEFDKEPDLRVWKKRTDLGDTPVYEPNCDVNRGVLVMDDDRTMPSDTWRRVYQHEHLSWSEVCNRFPLNYWQSLANLKSTGDKEKNMNAINAAFSKKVFVVFLDFVVDGMRNVKKSKEKYVRQAVMAERYRMNLPVVTLQSLYDVLLPSEPSSSSTPTLFIYKDMFYIGVSTSCHAEGLIEISAQEHEEMKNAALAVSGENDAS